MRSRRAGDDPGLPWPPCAAAGGAPGLRRLPGRGQCLGPALVQTARRYGLEAQGYRAEPEQLALLPLPAILHWDFDHFVVLERLCRTGAVLVDPALGRRRVAFLDLARHFTGAALAFRPSAGLARRPRKRPSLAKYREVFRRNLPALGQILLATLGLELVGLVFPVANQLLLDRVVVPKQLPWLWGLALGLGLAGTGAALLGLVRGWVVMGLQLELDFALTHRFLRHLVSLPLGFFLQRSPGDLIQRAQGNAVLQNLLGTQAVSALLDGFLLLGFGALMLAYNLRLGLLVIAISLVEAGAMALLWDWNRQLAAESLAAEGREGAARLEALTGLETTKANGAETRMVRRWAHRMTVRVNLGLDRERIHLGLGAVLGFCQALAALLVFLVGGREVMAQHMTLGCFMAFFALQGLFLAPLGSLLEALGQLQFLGTCLDRLDDVLETPPEPSGAGDPGRLRGRNRTAGSHLPLCRQCRSGAAGHRPDHPPPARRSPWSGLPAPARPPWRGRSWGCTRRNGAASSSMATT